MFWGPHNIATVTVGSTNANRYDYRGLKSEKKTPKALPSPPNCLGVRLPVRGAGGQQSIQASSGIPPSGQRYGENTASWRWISKMPNLCVHSGVALLLTRIVDNLQGCCNFQRCHKNKVFYKCQQAPLCPKYHILNQTKEGLLTGTP